MTLKNGKGFQGEGGLGVASGRRLADYGKRLRRKVLGVPLACEMILKKEEGVQGEEVSRQRTRLFWRRIPKNRDSAAEVLTFSASRETPRQTPNRSPNRAPTRASTRTQLNPKQTPQRERFAPYLAMFGFAWPGLGVRWCCLVLLGFAWCCLASLGVAWLGLGVSLRCLVLLGFAWRCLALLGVPWRCLAWPWR